MGNVEDDDEWEEKMVRNLSRMQVTDEETGECWAADHQAQSDCSSSSKMKSGGCQAAMKLASSWVKMNI